MDGRLILPDDAIIMRTFGVGLPEELPEPPKDESEEKRAARLAETGEERAARLARNRKRALRQRLRRAEKAGILPQRIYCSSQRFAYRAEELEAALERLPRNYIAALGEAG
jgi:hypothetical protein